MLPSVPPCGTAAHSGSRDGETVEDVVSYQALPMALETVGHPCRKMFCKMQAFRIWDVNQKIFYMRNNQLVAGYLQEANIAMEEVWKCRDSQLHESKKTTKSEKLDVVPTGLNRVFLGIHGRKLCLACVKSGDEIRLQLEPVDITTLSKKEEQKDRFTFIRSDNGPTTSFESVACPGWYLCTAVEADQPVSLTNTNEESVTVTKFYFQQD